MKNSKNPLFSRVLGILRNTSEHFKWLKCSVKNPLFMRGLGVSEHMEHLKVNTYYIHPNFYL